MVEQDRELEDYLAGRSPLSRAYQQAPREGPSAELDARIREAARFSAKKRPRWLLPLSAAAAVLLAFTVLIEMQQEGLDPVPVEKMEQAAPAAPPAEMQTAPAVEQRALKKSSPQPFPAAPEAAADAVAPAGAAAGSAAPMREESAPPAAMPEASRGARQDLEEESTEEWIERIRRLIAEGNTEAAKTEYGKFRMRYPDHPLPEDLQTVFEVP